MSDQKELIVELGAEGGGGELYRVKTETGGWVYQSGGSSMYLDDNDDESWREWTSEPSSELNEAVTMLYKQWFTLYPISIHPEYRAQIWQLVQFQAEQSEKDSDQNWSNYNLSRWREACQQS